MPIQILPIQLANQIAAGEVVERPASVVKELVENSLDSGASKIEIEIERGGHKRICIRDNGSGIDKEQLTLALSRHATSKISQLDDLEHIVSLGFRGEALASISSVSRLTLTSKPAKQDAAWQAHAQGRDMQVEINPAAHPDGTSVDVVDLFFNTPARRKFLRAEKTEFSHIDEIIRRVGLSRSDVTFILKHNGKVVRKYPAIKQQSDSLKRVAAICSNEFAQSAIYLESQFQDMTLKGWIVSAESRHSHSDVQYFYVNGRMMKDKLINHAIRQAYEGLIAPETSPAYVLYLELDPRQVDVNVHPAKHEVRFQQSRLVHDFIYKAVNDVLVSQFDEPQRDEFQNRHQDAQPNHDYIRPLTPNDQAMVTESTTSSEASPRFGGELQQPHHPPATGSRQSTVHGGQRGNYASPVLDSQAAKHYQSLMTVSPLNETIQVMLINERWLLLGLDGAFYKVLVEDILVWQLTENLQRSEIVSQPLLMPVSVQVEPDILNLIEPIKAALQPLGLDIQPASNRILLKQVPAGMRQMNWAKVLEQLFVIALQLAEEQRLQNSLKPQLVKLLAKEQLISLSQRGSLVGSLNQWLMGRNDLATQLKRVAQQINLAAWLDGDE